MSEKMLNGIPVADLSGSMDKLKNEPALGKYQFRAKTEWVNGANCRTTINDFCAAGVENSRAKSHMIEADEPADLQGTDIGANATEALLHALGSCLTTAFVYQAAVRDIQIEFLEFDLAGDIDLNGFLGLDESVRNGYEHIDVTCRVHSTASQEQLEQLCQAAQNRSPVFDIVTHEVPVSVTLEAQTIPAAQAGWKHHVAY